MQRYGKQQKQTTESSSKPEKGGELASEQMAELAREMLDSDQRVEGDQDPMLSMNNLASMPFNDFLILHKIFPKIFMMETDAKTLTIKPPPVGNRPTDPNESVANGRKTGTGPTRKLTTQETMRLQKALTRRTATLRHHSMVHVTVPDEVKNSF